MKQDFENIKDGQEVVLYPNESNPLHKKPIKAYCTDGYFVCEGSNPMDGPDYYWRDVGLYNDGYKLVDSAEAK